jgi:hypothetical protein
MTNIRKWSQTATGNATVAGGVNTINFAEGQLPSTVNNSAREMMAQVRKTYTPAEWGWVDCSATASVASQTTFKLTGDQTADYTANRRTRLKSGSTTRYGTIVSSSFTTETTVTITVDSGSLSASHTLAAVAAIDANHIPANTYVTSNSLSAALASYLTSASAALSTYFTSASAATALATKQGNILFKDEGSSLSSAGNASIIDFVGGGISASLTGGLVTVTVEGGGATLLGTITTTSGTSQALGSLTLTSYKTLRLILNGVSGDGAMTLALGNSSSDDVPVTVDTTGAGSSLTGIVTIDLGTGVATSVYSNVIGTGAGVVFTAVTAFTTSSTTITAISAGGDTFDAGSIVCYGVK